MLFNLYHMTMAASGFHICPINIIEKSMFQSINFAACRDRQKKQSNKSTAEKDSTCSFILNHRVVR